jgi:hypothetical protein
MGSDDPAVAQRIPAHEKDLGGLTVGRVRAAAAREDWIALRFPTVPGDEDEFIPYPQEAPLPLIDGAREGAPRCPPRGARDAPVTVRAALS